MGKLVPRLLIIRHGETEWSLNGRHTGVTDLPLTAHGEEVIQSKAHSVVGQGKLIDPDSVSHIIVSPRQRAQKTFQLLFAAVDKLPSFTTSNLVREWDYGDYEGLTTSEIHKKEPGWCIFRDGCLGGESSAEMTTRMDAVIAKVRQMHQRYFDNGEEGHDVIIVAHGHFTRSLIARWIGYPLPLGRQIYVEAGGVNILSYDHHNLNEPVITGLNLFVD